MLLHLNEDFDDDLLLDCMTLLEEWFMILKYFAFYFHQSHSFLLKAEDFLQNEGKIESYQARVLQILVFINTFDKNYFRMNTIRE